MAAISDRDFHTLLAGFSPTTAEILYRMPDHPSLQQSLYLAGLRRPHLLPPAHAFPQFLVAQSREQTLSRHSGPQEALHVVGVTAGR
jgi:uncharacterized protein Usg